MSVLIITELRDGKFTKASRELLSFGVHLAGQWSIPAHALVVGQTDEAELHSLAAHGPDSVVNINDERFNILDNRAWAHALTQVAEQKNAKVILFTHSNTGKALAPRVAVRYQAAYVPALTGVPKSMDPLVVTKKVMSGKAFADVAVKSDRAVLTLSPNIFEVAEKEADTTYEDARIEINDDLFTTKVKEVQKQTGKVLLTEAEIVVSGGRGMKGPENWGPIEELAGLLGGATACSRPVSDEGWRPHEEHTGQTGKIIAPNLYIAAGISGAIQHLAGVSSSKYIVAINTDKDAPIFEAADYGIVGDALKVLPALVEEVRKIKQ